MSPKARIVVTLLALAPFLVYGCRDWMNPYDDLKFTKAAWDADADGPGYRRRQMLDDLIARHLPHGMSEAAVVALLGEPTTRYGAEELEWDIGEHYMRNFDASLNVYFDVDHKLVHAVIYTD
jgi:hypothetical protein